MINVAAMWRHPINSLERETPDDVTLVAWQTVPSDRFDTDARQLQLRHAKLEEISCAPNPPFDTAGFLERVGSLCPPDGWTHQNFGVYATVRHSGRVVCNAKVEVV